MVYKVCKGGVRSGNTLRGLGTRKSKSYSRHACLVGHSTLPNKDITDLFESSTDDDLISSTLGSKDVILSLNKKQRWRLPATIGHMIKTGNFKSQETAVSLLERHKLKRRANCVSFVCNKGRYGHVIPKQRKYFSLNMENVNRDISNRKRKRQIAEQKQKLKAMAPKMKKDKRTDVTSVDAFTVSGVESAKSAPKPEEPTQPEYCLEVVYPCPKSCSLTFNPKYTDVRMEMGKRGEMEVKSNVKHSKAQRKHRKRFTEKDFAYLSLTDFDCDFEDFSSEFEDDNRNSKVDVQPDDEDSGLDSTANYDLKISDSGSESAGTDADHIQRSQFTENILSRLITEAEKAKALCVVNDKRRRPKSKRSGQTVEPDVEDKSHIVYTSEKREDRWSHSTKKRTARTKSTPKEKKGPEAPEPPTYETPRSARVVLSTQETSPTTLRQQFGNMYAEAECEPRRFMINVTSDVQNSLSMSRSAEPNAAFTSYLVFVYDGFYDEGLSTFRVYFNSNVSTDTESIYKDIPYEQTNINILMNWVICVLLSMKEASLLTLPFLTTSPKKFTSLPNFMNKRMGVSTEYFHISEEFLRFAYSEEIQEKSDFSEYSSSMDEYMDMDMFCGICYENVNPTQLDALPGSQLSKCGHLFCDECWRTHFRTRANDGALKMTCPGYQCDTEVGPVTLLSLLHVSEVSQLWQRSFEAEIETLDNFRWCPNPRCGRVIRVDVGDVSSSRPLDVKCVCGTHICFLCLSAAHFPATCDQAEQYLERLPSITVPQETVDEPSATPVVPVAPTPKKVKFVEIEGRVCPKCNRFMEKNGGCPHMKCKCGFEFCWKCMASYSQHFLQGCKPNPSFLFQLRRRVRVAHVELPKEPSADIPENSTRETPKPTNTRQKATMYQKALQQRQESAKSKYLGQMRELAHKIAVAAGKSPSLKIELLSLFGVNSREMDMNSLKLHSITPHAMKFLKSFNELKRALHHASEYTFVLLQDSEDSLEKRRALKLANDLSGYCSFIRSVLELGQHQDPWTAVQRLLEIQTWAERGLSALIALGNRLRRGTV